MVQGRATKNVNTVAPKMPRMARRAGQVIKPVRGGQQKQGAIAPRAQREKQRQR